MKIAIDPRKGSFGERFLEYCQEHGIEYKLIDCRSENIIAELADCDALAWHWSHQDNQLNFFVRQMTMALGLAGKAVFPNLNTCMLYDDKIGQKYLFEALDAPMVPTYVFYDLESALQWIEKTSFPKVFKLSRGAGSSNVRLVYTRRMARALARRMFGRGIAVYNRWEGVTDAWRKWRHGRGTLLSLLRRGKQLLLGNGYEKQFQRERGYVLFQDFIADNKFDIRVIVVGDKAFSIKRMCRENDFRASGSGRILYAKNDLNEECVEIAFSLAKKMQTQCVGFDFVFDEGHPLIVECSYGFSMRGYDACSGYWSDDMQWHPGKFNPEAFMMDDLLRSVSGR